jgi:hypothetical protein
VDGASMPEDIRGEADAGAAVAGLGAGDICIHKY